MSPKEHSYSTGQGKRSKKVIFSMISRSIYIGQNWFQTCSLQNRKQQIFVSETITIAAPGDKFGHIQNFNIIFIKINDEVNSVKLGFNIHTHSHTQNSRDFVDFHKFGSEAFFQVQCFVVNAFLFLVCQWENYPQSISVASLTLG